ncbi:pantetheine-phosphate adenylyltransferase [Limisalsivibrio acetivorans]|uniref:pantetheine-phosphate adenylyltransferase n=1 Tax=Limisalsivibrio acetivorans TaxID=1304888 RepID=UPI0003B436FC|nr:pantetheine-phosphate adenylyltransferase [Limisalsivibrio acetivorans]
MRAVYPGTFDPMTMGHLDIAERAAKLFDELVVAVAESRKKNTLFNVDERTEMVRESVSHISNIRVVNFNSLLVKFMSEMESKTVIRGLRAVSDFEYEFQLALMNRKLDDELDTVFLMPTKQYIFLSSSMVREIGALGGDIRSFVPGPVLKKMQERFCGDENTPCWGD